MDTQSTPQVVEFNDSFHMRKATVFYGVQAGLSQAVDNGEIERATARSLFDYIEAELETGYANPFKTFEVTVSLWGNDIFTVEVEADDESSACDEVSDNISLDSLSVAFNAETNSGNGGYGSFDGEVSSWSNIYDHIVEALEYSATETE